MCNECGKTHEKKISLRMGRGGMRSLPFFTKHTKITVTWIILAIWNIIIRENNIDNKYWMRKDKTIFERDWESIILSHHSFISLQFYRICNMGEHSCYQRAFRCMEYRPRIPHCNFDLANSLYGNCCISKTISARRSAEVSKSSQRNPLRYL